MIQRDVIEQILTDACRAPSADNTQPWRFKVKGNVIQIINAGDQKESIFNYHQMVNHVSIGACIENLRISSESKGFRCKIRLFPDSSNPLIVAEVTLSADASIQNELAPYIGQRSSNRKKYHRKPIEKDIYQTLMELNESGEERVSFVSGTIAVRELASIVSVGEKLALENKSIHDFLFAHVTWSKKEDEKTPGFFIDTFEFAPPQRALFKLFRNWSILKWFIPLGFPNFVAKDMAKIYATSAAFGFITTDNNSPEAYVRAGMTFERIWLTATKLGLSIQPTTGLIFFAQPILEGDTFELSTATVSLIKSRYFNLKEKAHINEREHVAMLFRIGYADAPTATTSRFAPKISFED